MKTTPTTLPTKDWLDYKHARELANTIRSYWWARGLHVEVRIEPVYDDSLAYPWAIRSNLVNGLPPR